MKRQDDHTEASGASCSLPDRTALLARYAVLDTPREAEFDDIAKLAAAICEAPIAVVNFISNDRQWFKAEVGLGVRETPLETSFCVHAVLEQDYLEVPDATADSRFACNPLVTVEGGIRFYAGALLKTGDGEAIGTLCVLDTVVRPEGLSDLQRFTLRTLATQVMAQLELRRAASLEREARRQLETDRTRFEQIFNSTVDYAIIVMNPDGCITDWNEGATRILGWTPDEICGHDLSAFFTPEDRGAGIPQLEMENALANGRGIDERWHLRKNGERFWADGEMMPLYDTASQPVGFIKVLRDRTDARLAEEQLKMQDERLQMALAASGAVGLWDWMVDTDLLHGDANFARLYGLDLARTAAGLTMEEYQEHVVPEDLGPLRERIRAVFQRGENFLAEYRLVIPGQPLRWVECKGRMVSDDEGRPHRFSGTAVDITARKTAEEQKQLLMEEMSHRVKNTFAMVQALVHQTLRGSDPALVDTLQGRLAALSRAHDILLQGSGLSMPMTELLERVLRLAAEGDRFVLDGPEFQVDPEAALSLSLLLHELATNATKYGALSEAAGRVRVSWRLEGECFRLFWDEEGGPPARPPLRTGFGSKLIAMGIRGHRAAKLHYAPDGLHASFEADHQSVILDTRVDSGDLLVPASGRYFD